MTLAKKKEIREDRKNSRISAASILGVLGLVLGWLTFEGTGPTIYGSNAVVADNMLVLADVDG
jgi:hypothetical protein